MSATSSARVEQGRNRRDRFWSAMRYRYTPYLLLLPAVLVTLAIVFYPIVRSLWISLHYYVLTRLRFVEFIGLENYRTVLSDRVFWTSLRHSVIYVGFTVSAQFVFGLITALLLNQKFWGRGFVRAIILVPWVTPGVLTGFMWRWIYDGNFGVLNQALIDLGILSSSIPWLAQSSTALGGVIIATIWQGIPFFAIMLLAALQAVPLELYEAADIDGASTWQKFLRITLPLIYPTVLITLLLRMIWVSNYVDIIYVMTAGGPGHSSLTLPVYTFMTARSGLDYGYAATLSVYLTLCLLVVIALYIWMLRRSEAR